MELSKKTKEQRKNKHNTSAIVEDSAYNSKIAQLGLVMF